MATTTSQHAFTAQTPRAVLKQYETSAANTALTVSTPTTRSRVLRVLAVYVKYSTNVTKDVTITYNAGHGSGYDCLHQTISLATADEGVFVPDEAVYLDPEDAYDATAPAGGAGVTAAITIVCLEY